MPGNSQVGDQFRKAERISGQQHSLEQKDRRRARPCAARQAQQYDRNAPLNGKQKRWFTIKFQRETHSRNPIPILYCSGLCDPSVDEHRDGGHGGPFPRAAPADRAKQAASRRPRQVAARHRSSRPSGRLSKGGAAGAGPAHRQRLATREARWSPPESSDYPPVRRATARSGPPADLRRTQRRRDCWLLSRAMRAHVRCACGRLPAAPSRCAPPLPAGCAPTPSSVTFSGRATRSGRT